MKMTKMLVCVAAALAALAGGAAADGSDDVVIENARLKLTIGANARAKALVVKETGEQLLDLREDIPVFSVIQDRPFNNEVKLTFPNKRTEFRADRVRRVGADLFVGFELISYEAKIHLTEADDYVLFRDPKMAKVALKPGEFAIFYPPYGAHAPNKTEGAPRPHRKIVVKVKA